MGGASKLLSSLLLPSSPLRLRPSAAAFALFLSPPAAASRRQLLLSPPYPLLTLSTSAAAASSLPYNFTSASSAPPPHATFPEWSRLVDRLAAAGYAARAPSPADELAVTPGCGLPADAEAAVSSCLAFARDRPDILRSLPRKDVEVVVAHVAPDMFKDGEASVERLQQYLAGEERNVIQPVRAETVDIVRYLLSYACSSSGYNSEDKELTHSAVRNILAELVNSSGLPQTSDFVESSGGQQSLSQDERFTRITGQNIEMKRGDWICNRCSFMNFARNARCLECNEHRPKKMLTGGEWECPQCEFYNYGRNMSCLRCDCKRPATVPPNPASAGAGLDGMAKSVDVPNGTKSEIEKLLAQNDEKAERWLSKVSQLDDSADLSSLAADEDFPEIMPMRKGVNKFVVSTRKTPLERRLANAQYSSDNSPQAASSGSKVSQTLDRILGRPTSTSSPNNKSGNGDVNAGAPKKSSDHLGDIDLVPFVPLSRDLFAKPQNTNSIAQGKKDGQIIAEAGSSTSNSSVTSNERSDGNNSLDTAEKWSQKVAGLDNVTDLSSAVPDEDFPEIMPMRKGENRFVISKKKDRSLASPQYKRRSVLEQADNSSFAPFVPFPPGYFAKKDKPMKSAPDTGGSPPAEKLPETNPSSGNSRINRNTSKAIGNQVNNNLHDENLNRNYSQQNTSAGSSAGESSNYEHQPHSHEVGFKSSGTSNTGPWNKEFSQRSFNEDRDRSTYGGGNTGQPPSYTSGYSSNNNAWGHDNNDSNNGSYDNNGAWSNNAQSSNSHNNWSGSDAHNNSATSGNRHNNWSGSYANNNSGTSGNNPNNWRGSYADNNNATSGNSHNKRSGSYADNNSATSGNSHKNWSGVYADIYSATSGTASSNPNQAAGYSSYGNSSNRGYTGKSLEGSAVKDPDPLDMSEEAKAERWFRRAAQIKDISELANIPDEDFPEIMPMRKGVNRFVVSKRKTPLERRLTSPQYRRNLPIVSSEPDRDAS